MLSLFKRELTIYMLSLLTLLGFFLLMQNALRGSVVMQEKVNLQAVGYELSKRQRAWVQPIEVSTKPPAPTLGERLKKILNCADWPLRLEKLQYGSDYWLIRNFVRGTLSINVGCADTITYTTNGDYTFFDNLPALVKRWLAPISFAVFAPGYDMMTTMDAIQYVRRCLPESELIRQYVTFHIYFPAAHMPKYVPLDEQEIFHWEYDCYLQEAPYENVSRVDMYKSVHNLTYPINVGRNIARKAANTHFIFASDIELLPSPGLAQQFLEMVERNQSVIFGGKYGKHVKRVFPLPVFELQKNASIPETKTELVKMLRGKQAIPFHSMICKNCHLVPQQDAWVNATVQEHNPLMVFSVTKRQGKFKYWEPFYISDNREPIFDERVTWEGQSNKRIQGYAMCLLGYEYHVLHPAFLVHTPGIKAFNKNSPRIKYVGPMNRLIKHKIEPEYRTLFGNNNECRT